MIIGIDCDNVLNNLCEAVLEVYNEDAADSLNINDIKEYYIEKFVKDKFKENFYQYFLDSRVWKKIKIIENCQKVISELYRAGHEIIFITSTEPRNFAKKFDWFKRNFPYLNIKKSLFCCPIKQYMSGIDILIDDAIQNIGKEAYKTILLSYPWNRDFQVDNIRTFRANDWTEILEIINNN